MKKLLLLCVLPLCYITASGQDPVQKPLSFVYKKTATWCPHCGGWGWDLKKRLLSGLKDDAVLLTLYASNTSKIFVPAAYELVSYFDSPSGYPDFGVNGIAGMQTEKEVLDAVREFSASRPEAGPASRASVSGSRVDLEARVTFWDAAEGDYYLAAYVVEDGVMEEQEGHSGNVSHRNVLRASMTATAFGERVASGSIAAGESFSKAFSYTLPAGWDVSKLRFYTMIWKRNGVRYQYVNGAADERNPTSVREAGEMRMKLHIAPNPAADWLSVKAEGGGLGEVDVELRDLSGKRVSSARSGINTGGEIRMDVRGLSEGVYNVYLKAEGVTAVEKVYIVR